MENNNNNIDKYFRKLSEEQEPKTFKKMDAIWDKVEEKLDQKKKKRIVPFWKYTGVAASLLLLVGLGTHFIGNNSQNPTEQIVTINEESFQKEIEKTSLEDAVVIEDKTTFIIPENSVENEMLFETDNATFNQKSVEVQAESYVNVQKTEVITLANSTAKSDTKSSLSSFTYNLASAEQINTKTITEKTIRGTVTSAEDGLPLPGASIVVKGTSRGTQTDLDGKYSVEVTIGETLEFSFLGMNVKEIKVGTPDTINVSLEYNGNLIESVVVMGYGTTTKEAYVGTATRSVNSPNYESSGYVADYDRIDNEYFKRKTENSISIKETNTESYENFTENQFESTKTNPVSTFSIDVDNASYTNIRRFLNNGQTVPKDAVRIEEMMNFFKYDYPKPKDKHPFSINTEYSDAPWNPNHKLLKIGLQGKEIPTDKLPKSNFVFLVDVSGSMSDANKLPLLKSSMKVLLDELRDEDRVSIVYYANNVGVLLEPTKAKEKKKIIKVIDNMTASGGTSGGAGLELAYKMAEKHFVKGGNNRIILATDGDFNIGKSSDSEMQQLIEEKRKSGVFLTCLGFGMGNYKDSKMITLSKKGNGNYAYIDNIQEANRFLGKEFKGSMYAIAKDVKIQIEFNPAHVQAYRLIGYEMRKLRNEDFSNDAIDAGELGSGHTVTALYEVIPNGIKSEFYSYENDLKYSQTNPVTGSFQNELATIKFRYKKPDGDKSIEMVHTIPNQKTALQNASKDFKFASAVAWFGLKLRDSQLIPNKESKEIIKLAQDGLHNDVDGYKAEFIRLVKSVK